MSEEVKETIIEFESVKKGRKAIFFVLIGLFVLTTVAFMLLWILKPAGAAVGIQEITLASTDIKSVGVDESGNNKYIASVGGTYTVSADVSYVGNVDAASAVEWAVSPSGAVNITSTQTDPENPNRSIMTFTVTSSALGTDGSEREITVRATSPLGKDVVSEFKFTARANYAAEGKIDSVKLGDRSFSVKVIDGQHYSVEVPYFSTDISNTDMFTFSVNVAQFAAKAENGEYMELSRGIAGTEGKNIDNIRYSVETGDAAEIAYANMNGESTFVRVLKAGKATVKATLNAFNPAAEIPIYLEITAKDIKEYKDVLSFVRFKRSEYTLFLHESRQEDLFDLQNEILFSQDPPEGRTWEYDVYESDVSGNPVTQNRKLTIRRTQTDGKTVITMGPVEGGTAGNTSITVKDVSANGYGVMYTVPVKIRNPVYSASGGALGVTVNGKTTVSDYQGNTFDVNVEYKLRDYDGKLTADNITSELYFYYTNPAHAPLGNTFTIPPTQNVSFSTMKYKGEITVEGKTTRIYSVSPTAVKISDDGKTATATVQAKIGGLTPNEPIGVNFVTFPQSSHYDPDVLNAAIVGSGDEIYITAPQLEVIVLETVSKIEIQSEEVLKEVLDDGSRFFAHGAKNNYRLVRPAGITAESNYSVFDLFEYTGTKGSVDFGDNVPENLTVEVKSGDGDVLNDDYKLAGSETQTTSPTVISVTLTSGKETTVYTIELLYKTVIKEAKLLDVTVINSTYKLESNAYDGNEYGFVSFDNGRILNFPNVVKFHDYSGVERDNTNWTIERYIFIDESMLVKKNRDEVSGASETMAYYFYLPSQIKDGVTPAAAEALYKMNTNGDIAVNRDLYAYEKNNTDINCHSVNVVYSAYKLKYENGKFVLYDDYFGEIEYEDYNALARGGLMAARNYVAHRGFDRVAFYDASGNVTSSLDVNVNSTFTLRPVGIVKYYDEKTGELTEVADSDKDSTGNLKIVNNLPEKISVQNESDYQYRVDNRQSENLANAFTVYAEFTTRNGETNGTVTDEARNASLTLKVLDMFLPVDTFRIYATESNAENGSNAISGNVMQLVNGSADKKEIQLFIRLNYVENTSYSYLSGLKFQCKFGNNTYGDIDGTRDFGAFTVTITNNPSETNHVSIPSGEVYHIVKVVFTLKDNNTVNGKYSFTITPQVSGEQISNQTAKIEFDLDVTTYADGVTLSKNNGADTNSELVDNGSDYTANINLNTSASGVTAPNAMTIDVTPTVGSGYIADNRNIEVSVDSATANDDFFTVSASVYGITLTPKTKTCVNKPFTVKITETRYTFSGTAWETITAEKTVTVFVNVTTDIYSVAFGSPSGDITVYVTGASSGKASADFTASYNSADTQNLSADDGLEYLLSDNKDGKLSVSGNTVVADNDLGDCVVYLTVRSKKNHNIQAQKTVRIVSLDRTLSFTDFAAGGGDNYTATYANGNTDSATAEIVYFGENSMNFALSGITVGDNYEISYTADNGVSVDGDGVATWTGGGVKRFTLEAAVTIKSGSSTRSKTLTATVTANARAVSFDGLESIKGYTGKDGSYVYITAYEGIVLDLSNLVPKDGDDRDAANIGYTLEKYGEAGNANDKITIGNKTLTVLSLDSDGFAYVKVTADKHEKDGETNQYSVILKIELKALTADDKVLKLTQGGTVHDGDDINVSGTSSNEFTVGFGSSVVADKLVKVYGATVEYSLTTENNAASINGDTVTVNAVKSGSFTVTATVKIGGETVFTSSITKNVVSSAALEVKFGTSENYESAVDANKLDIGYTDDNEKFVYVFVSYGDFGTVPNNAAFTPYISGVTATLEGEVTHDTANKRFVAKYSITPVAYVGSTIKTDFGTATLGGTLSFGGFDYTATKTVNLTATAPTVKLPANDSYSIAPSVYGETANSQVLNTSVSGYTAGTGYSVTYELLSDGSLNGGVYNAADNILMLNAARNSTGATFTAKSYVGANGEILSYAKNSVKLRIKVVIEQGIYKGYATEKIVTVSVTAPGAIPEISLDTTSGSKYSSEYGGIVLSKAEDNVTLYASSGSSGLDMLGSAFNVNMPNGTTYSIKNGANNDYHSQNGVALSSNSVYGYEPAKIGKDSVTVTVTVTSGAYTGAKIGITFNAFHLPTVNINNGNRNDLYATDGHNVTVTVSAATVGGVVPELTLRADNGLGYIVAGDTAGTFTFVPNANVSGDTALTAYATYTSGDFAGRTIVSQYGITVRVLSASFADKATDSDGNGVNGRKVYVTPDTDFDLSAVTVNKLGAGAGETNTFSLELVSGAYDESKLSLDGKTLKAAVNANPNLSGGITYSNAIKITVRQGSNYYVGYADIVVEMRALDDKPTKLTVTGSNHSYTLSVDGVTSSVAYSATIEQGAAAVNGNVTVNDGTLSFTPNIVKKDTSVVILVTATVQTRCYGTLTFTEYITETVTATVDPTPTLDITYDSKTFTVTLDSKGVDGVSIENITLSGGADGFTLHAGNNGVYAYTYIANGNANITFAASATVVDGDHNGTTVTVSKTIEVVPTQARVMPTFSIGGADGSYNLTVNNASDPEYNYSIIAGGDILQGADGNKVNISGNRLTFTANTVKVDTQVVIRVSATVTVPYYGTVTLYKDISETVKGVPDEKPELSIEHNDTAHTVTVKVKIGDKFVDISNIKDIKLISSNSGLVLTAGANGVYDYTFVAKTPERISFAAFATVNVDGSDYNGTQIAANGEFTVTPTTVPADPEVMPELTATVGKIIVKDDSDKSAIQAEVTITLSTTTGVSLDGVTFAGLDGVTLTENYDETSKTYAYTCTYTFTYNEADGVAEKAFTVFATVNGGEHIGTIIKSGGTVGKIAPVEPVGPTPDTEEPEITE